MNSLVTNLLCFSGILNFVHQAPPLSVSEARNNMQRYRIYDVICDVKSADNLYALKLYTIKIFFLSLI